MQKLISWFWRRVPMSLKWTVIRLFNVNFLVAVAGIITNDKDEILLLKHRYWINQMWGMPGGYMVSGETAEEALQREVMEEVGLKLKDIQFVYAETSSNDRIILFLKAKADGELGKIDSKEILEAGFFIKDQLPSPLLKSHSNIYLSFISSDMR
jgi:NADH pyrophosphatase NudC (nudix superfamily)